MAKEQKEIRRFLAGTVSSPSSADIPDDAAIYSKNLEPINEEGKLKGCQEETGYKHSSIDSQTFTYADKFGLSDSIMANGDTLDFYISNEKVATVTAPNPQGDSTDMFLQRNLILGAISTIEAHPHCDSASIITFNGYDSNGLTNEPAFYDIPEHFNASYNSADTLVQFKKDDGTVGFDSKNIFIGQYIKIETDEIVSVTNILNETDGYVEIARGQYDTTAQSITDSHTLDGFGDFNAIQITWKPGVDTPDFKMIHTPASGDSADVITWTTENTTPYLDIHARNMVVTNHKEPDSEMTTTNVVFYDVDNTVSPPSSQMKVIKDFYAQDGGPELIEPSQAHVNGEPESIALATGPNGVYIGTGDSANSKSQWFGEILHRRFGEKVEGYHLEDAECKALDDGQALFSFNSMEFPYTCSSDASPSPTITDSFAFAIAPKKHTLFAVKTDDSSPADSYGKHYKSDSLGIDPAAICSSRHVLKVMADTDNEGSTHEPFTPLLWNGTSESSIDGHTDVTSYLWISSQTDTDKLYLYAARFQNDGSSPLTLQSQLRSYTLKFQITTTAIMNLNIAEGTVIERKPKPGSYISDIMEFNDKIYILYSHAGGFTFDEEWLYVADLTELTNPSDGTITFKPITPAAMKVKNWGKDTDNVGYNWYMPPDIFDGSGLNAGHWIGQCGSRGCYANSFKWKNCDMLGYQHDGTHVLDEDSGGTWNNAIADQIGTFSASESNKFPGYNMQNTSPYTSDRQSDNPYVENNNGYSGRKFGASYGFTDYVVIPLAKGLTRYRNSDDIGVVVHLEGTQICSDITLNKNIRKWERKSGFSRYKRYVTYNSTEPVLKDWNEYVLMTTSDDRFGVRQRHVPDNSVFYVGSTANYVSSSGVHWLYHTVNELSDNICHLSSNGTYNGTWSDLGGGLGEINNENERDADNKVKNQKNAFRCGTYYNLNATTETNTDGYGTINPYQRRYNQHLYSFEQAVQVQSGQSGNDQQLLKPTKGRVVDLAKNREINTSGGDDSYCNIFMSLRDNNNYTTDTYIGRWATTSSNLHQGTSTFPVDFPNASGLSATYIENPYKIAGIGSCILTADLDTSTSPEIYKITLSPTSGDYKSGFVKYQASGANEGKYASPVDGVDVEYSGEYPGFWSYPEGQLDFGMSIDFTNGQGDASSNFNNGQTYYWKITMLYDGYQEGPLTNFEFSGTPAGQNFKTAQLQVSISDPPKRVSHVVIYRKNSAEEFYRMVAEQPLDSGWVYNSIKDQWRAFIVDDGLQKASYEAITGLPESLTETTVNYKLSCSAMGHLVVADCYHPEIRQGQNFLFKSKPNAWSNFEWSRDFCILPNKPTHIIWWAGRIYAFDYSNTYKINLLNLVLEDTYEGVGCIGPDSCIVTDIGMFFCDYQGMYMHNGTTTQNIGRDVLLSSFGGDQDSVLENSAANDTSYQYHNWQHINHNRDPQVLYDSKTQSVYFCFEDKHSDGTLFSGAWVYSVTRKRWDMRELPTPIGKLTGNRNDIYVSNANYLWQIANSNNATKKWNFKSKVFDLNSSSQDKIFSKVKIVCNNTVKAKDLSDGGVGTITVYVDGEAVPSSSVLIESEDNVVSVKLLGSEKKGKKMRLELTDFMVEVDSFAIIYRRGTIK